VIAGGSAGGYLSNMAGLTTGPGDPKAADEVDRESSAVQAVFTLYGLSDARAFGNDPRMKPLFGAWNVEEASPINHVSRTAPPFLLVHGEKDQSVPLAQSTDLQKALKAAGVPCELIVIPGGAHGTMVWHRLPGVPDWEKQTIAWLNATLHHEGANGPGIIAREVAK
jgi:dipeptidyl aminopeptidase/acylaminoacyl peptidase